MRNEWNKKNKSKLIFVQNFDCHKWWWSAAAVNGALSGAEW